MPSAANTPQTMPQSVIELVCHTMTELREAPNETIAADVVWLGSTSCPSRLTPGTPYRSKRAVSF